MKHVGKCLALRTKGGAASLGALKEVLAMILEECAMSGTLHRRHSMTFTLTVKCIRPKELRRLDRKHLAFITRIDELIRKNSVDVEAIVRTHLNETLSTHCSLCGHPQSAHIFRPETGWTGCEECQLAPADLTFDDRVRTLPNGRMAWKAEHAFQGIEP